MNVAIVAPSPVPFVMGGAENLWLGLQRYINEETTHYCELFKIPSKESSISEVLKTYQRFSKLDFEGFDKLISTKYPAWMCEHNHHVLYMQHTLRGLYDTYHFCQKPLAIPSKYKEVISCLDGFYIDKDKVLYEFFEKVEGFLNKYPELNEFPGPLSRNVVRALDGYALQKNKISKYCAISNTVASRKEYFPENISPSVIYHPPRLSGFYCETDEFIFTTSRLDGPKRIGLIIEAMRHVTADIKLLIGGTGPDEARLKELAAGDSRIVFLGYLEDREVLNYYANSLVVPFVPYDEDYGLITIEAMQSSKPVITTTDAGGVTEFVIDQETGLVVPPEPEALGKAIEYMCRNRSHAKQMGINAKAKVADITWANVAEGLLGIKPEQKIYSLPNQKVFSKTPKKKMVVAVTFPVYPPRGGGQSRIYHLYREWAKTYDVVIISLVGIDSQKTTNEIAPGLTEIQIPKSSEHQRGEDRLSKSVNWVPVTDIAAITEIYKTKDFLDCVGQECANADVIVASHPYLLDVLLQNAPQAELWFEAQDVELDLKNNILPSTKFSSELLDRVKANESKAWRAAKVVFACAENDLRRLDELYGKNSALNIEIANGFSKDEVAYFPLSERNKLKQELGLQDKYSALFMGSWHGPNLEVVERMIVYAQNLPGVNFIVAGSAGLKFSDQKLPENLKVLGILDEGQKRVLLSAVDLALNPMTSGSGSNLKMLDYMASGTPVLSTHFGARGLELIAGEHYLESEIDDFEKAIMGFFVELDDACKNQISKKAADFAFDKYEWKIIAQSGLEVILNGIKKL